MADIRKRKGAKGITYQVRYPSSKTKSGYAYATFNTMKEARVFLESGRMKEAARSTGEQALTVEKGIQIWLDVCEKEGRGGRQPVTPYTLKTYRYRAEIIKEYEWDKPLNELSTPDVVEFRSWLLKNYSRDQARKVLSYFHSMVLELVTRGQLQHDFASGVRVAAASRYDELVRIPSEAEIHALLAAADHLANARNQQIARVWQRYRPMLYLAVDSGMRPQEYLVMAKANIGERGVLVDRALDAGGKTISVTKSRAGRRFIDLSPETIAMVRHYAENTAVRNDFDLVFPTSNGKWQSSNNWRRRGFVTACMKAGLIEKSEIDGETVEVPKYKPYDLRHFYASMLIENRVNLKRIQKLMGHSDIQTTLNVYGHVIERVEWKQEEQSGLIASMARNACGKSVASPMQAVEMPM